MYKPNLLFEHTQEELNDPFLSWKRSDQAFFAAGACHILSEMFRQLHFSEDYETIFIKLLGGLPGMHVYMSNGTWAFDHNGWTLEKELLDNTRDVYTKHNPVWGFERIIVKDDLETFCQKNNHRLPWQYAYLPWERAYNYIKRFPNTPPA